jgi:citrate synthase
MSEKTAKIRLDNDSEISLPIFQPTIGKPLVDVSQLGANGLFTYDPGFMSTAACESKITYINGEKGILLHRGYPIAELAAHKDFIEVAFLLIHGELPTEAEHEELARFIKQEQPIDSETIELFKGLSTTGHPMGMLISAVGALAAKYHADIDLKTEEGRMQAALQMIAKISNLAAMAYRHGQGQAFVAPDESLGYAENFLYMMFGTKPDPVIAHAMDVIFTLHADHEQNASTSTVRLTGSTGANPFACTAAGIAALWGPAHGGANEACLDMLKTIGNISEIPKYLAKAKDKNDPFRLMGFGHRVYKNYDPRATVMRQICHDVLDVVGAHNTPLFQLAMELERIALEDPYFVERKLYPNIDFYSGITLSAIGIPSNMFTVIFALARTTGWMAQWLEMTGEPMKIGRPRQRYTGYTERHLP